MTDDQSQAMNPTSSASHRVRSALRICRTILLEPYRRHGVSVAVLTGYTRALDVVDFFEPTRAPGQSGLHRLISTAEDASWATASEDRDRIENGCTGLALFAQDGTVLCRVWIVLGRQHPSVLDRAIRLAPTTAYVFGLYTHPTARRRGLAQWMLRAAEGAAVRSGATTALAWIERRNNASRLLFVGMGWQRAATTLRVVHGGRVWFGFNRVRSEYLHAFAPATLRR